MNKKSLALIAIAALGLIALTIYLMRPPAAAPAPTTESSAQSAPAERTQSPTVEGTSITQEGTIACLQPRQADGPRDLSCAIGLNVDELTSYGLFADDPTMTGSMPTGQRVVVQGTLVPSQTDTYRDAGTIRVETIRKR